MNKSLLILVLICSVFSTQVYSDGPRPEIKGYTETREFTRRMAETREGRSAMQGPMQNIVRRASGYENVPEASRLEIEQRLKNHEREMREANGDPRKTEEANRRLAQAMQLAIYSSGGKVLGEIPAPTQAYGKDHPLHQYRERLEKVTQEQQSKKTTEEQNRLVAEFIKTERAVETNPVFAQLPVEQRQEVLDALASYRSDHLAGGQHMGNFKRVENEIREMEQYLKGAKDPKERAELGEALFAFLGDIRTSARLGRLDAGVTDGAVHGFKAIIEKAKGTPNYMDVIMGLKVGMHAIRDLRHQTLGTNKAWIDELVFNNLEEAPGLKAELKKVFDSIPGDTEVAQRKRGKALEKALADMVDKGQISREEVRKGLGKISREHIRKILEMMKEKKIDHATACKLLRDCMAKHGLDSGALAEQCPLTAGAAGGKGTHTAPTKNRGNQ